LKENPWCDWFTVEMQREIESKVEILNDFVVRSNEILKEYDKNTSETEQYITVKYIAMVPVDAVTIDPFSETRLEKCEEWVDEKTTSRAFFAVRDGKVLLGSEYLPRLYREYDHDQEPPKKHVVIDGNHRIAAARKKGLSTILATIMETITIKKPS
jgi:hypothetical protein